MIWKRGGFIIQRHNELRDLEADLLDLVCNDEEKEPLLQEITKETLNNGANLACDARLNVHARGFWERQKSTFFDLRVCHPNADSYKDLTPEQVYRLRENEKKRIYERGVLEVEKASFTPLVFTTTGGMGRECLRYHSRLTEQMVYKMIMFNLLRATRIFCTFIADSVFRLIKNESREEIKLPFNACQGLIRTLSKLEHFLFFIISDYSPFLMQWKSVVGQIFSFQYFSPLRPHHSFFRNYWPYSFLIKCS